MQLASDLVSGVMIWSFDWKEQMRIFFVMGKISSRVLLIKFASIRLIASRDSDIIHAVIWKDMHASVCQ